ncbi:unnamed protein product [Adineta steineri]|uniref:Uncharacterized protein n=1 Tax=Adineta steineri TaxID=433720 RepID=A0A813R2V6_9BILA|nr:unnamed protein product [Adineta steineri]CAF0908707.1 unnamed protein product [Adineta steineri]CAF1474968.1 unnamed protein product [Adineta steineri]
MNSFVVSVLLAFSILVLISNASNCGIRSKSRIAGGDESAIGSWPWMISLRAKDFPQHLCGGSLIHRKYVLTAGHCTFLFLPSQYEVHIGLHYQNSTDHFISPVKTIYRHSNYTSTVEFSQTVYDFAVLELERDTEDKFNTICLPTLMENLNVASKINTTTLGWGRTSPNATSLSQTLQEVTLVLLNSSSKECIKTDQGPLIVNDSLQLCAGRLEGGFGTCGSDSGGPLMVQCPLDSRWYLIGITSYAWGCGLPASPTIFLRVSAYIPWMTENIPELFIIQPSSTMPTTLLTTTTTTTRATISIEQTTNFNPASSVASIKFINRISNETISQYDDLQVMEVPEHGDRAHIIVYLDFRSDLQLIKNVKDQKCQLSNMEQETKIAYPRLFLSESSGDGFAVPDLPIDASNVEKIHIFKLEREETIQNTSYLRSELQQACAGLPVHWADSVDEKDLDRMTENGEIFYDRTENTILKPANAESRLSRGNSCNPNPQGLPPSQYDCHGMCVNQKCRMSSESGYYFIMCPMNGNIGQSCSQHMLHMGGQCKLCCDDPGSSCSAPTNGGYWQRCDCVKW